jgi:CheY-like chemotaxis protein
MEIAVLIVDDDSGFRGLAAELLRARGYRVIGEAGSAQEAMVLVREVRPDAVLLDVELPDGDGVALADRLRAEEHAPRVLLTSTEVCGVEPFVLKAELAGADFDAYFNPAGGSRP